MIMSTESPEYKIFLFIKEPMPNMKVKINFLSSTLNIPLKSMQINLCALKCDAKNVKNNRKTEFEKVHKLSLKTHESGIQFNLIFYFT